MLYIIRQTAYTLFSFCAFLVMAVELTVRGFFLITIGGATDEHKLRYHRLLQRRSRFAISHVPGTTFSYSNPSGETFEKPSVIISNHQSHLDLMGIMMLTPRMIILTKSWVWHNPFYGAVIRYADFFPVSDTEQMTAKLRGMVAKGYSVMIFPEGTRSADSRVQRFYRGAMYLAEQLSLDVVPVYISGFGTVLPKPSYHLHQGHMSVEVMPRIKRGEEPLASGYQEATRAMHRRYVAKQQQDSNSQ